MQDGVVHRMAMMVPLFLLGALSLGRAQDGRNPNKFDGPAELPRVHVKSALSDTPAPGKSILVANAADFRSAIDKAACGDTIRLQAGAEFAGNFKFPAKSCDDAHWIVVRTSAADKDLPPEGSRINPCYAGVASLPGRPRYTCASSANVTAKIVYNSGGSGPISFSEGANHYRFIGLEITRDSPALTIYNLTLFSNNNGGDHIIFDRVWMHGGARTKPLAASCLEPPGMLPSWTPTSAISIALQKPEAASIRRPLPEVWATAKWGPTRLSIIFWRERGKT